MNIAADDIDDDLQAIYLRQWHALRAHLRRRTGSLDVAEDALQETWFRVAGLTNPAAVRDKKAFLLRIAGNIAIDIIRRERRHQGRCTADEAILAAIEDLAPSPETIVIDRDQLRALVSALTELPGKARAALLMSRCDGLSHRDIAARLKVSESMVAKYLAQSLRHCRDAFRALG
ncbi:RNA polymerase sigma factor [Rhizobium sp. SYY.PMSO]|uniref:RNA polymerase sigma factor n=1 Tax=Rhizobium sp. SYY.PMSO TaxID=3382192 RepID=UPI000DDA70C9